MAAYGTNGRHKPKLEAEPCRHPASGLFVLDAVYRIIIGNVPGFEDDGPEDHE